MAAVSPRFTAVLLGGHPAEPIYSKKLLVFQFVLERSAASIGTSPQPLPQKLRPEVEIVFQTCLSRGVVVQGRRRSTISGK